MKASFHLKKTSLAIILNMAAALFFSSVVYALPITPSDVSSYETPADELLEASVDISISESTSTIMVPSDTIVPEDYAISVIGFDVSGDDGGDDQQVPDASIMLLLGSSLLGLALLSKRKSKN